MSKYDNVSSDFLEIIAGTDNKTSMAYTEAKKEMEKNPDKSMIQLKNFYKDIEVTYKNINKKTEQSIIKSRGDLSKFSGYENMQYAFDLLSSPLKSNSIMKHLIIIKNELEDNRLIYMEAYRRKIRILMHEYENIVYLLQTGLCMLFADCVQITKKDPGYIINASAKSDNKFIVNTLSRLASNVKDKSHKKYLESILEAAKKSVNNKNYPTSVNESYDEEVFTEANVLFTYIASFSSIMDSIATMFTGLKSIFNSIKQSLFGIIPLIRSIIYLRYKKKADTILALEMNIALIKENIELLKRSKSKSESEKKEIIKKQEAICEQYEKRVEKLKAELGETEYEASKALKQNESNLKKTDDKSNNDDFVLEGTNMTELFNEIGKMNKHISE